MVDKLDKQIKFSFENKKINLKSKIQQLNILSYKETLKGVFQLRKNTKIIISDDELKRNDEFEIEFYKNKTKVKKFDETFADIFLFFKRALYFADEFPNLFGCFCEGGLITGVAGKNDKILIDGVEIKTFENGEFIFAFGRKYKDTIKVKFNDKLKIFNIKKKI